MPRKYFDHERLTVYQDSLKFVVWINELLERIPSKLAVHNQLDRASKSIPLNIAEGTAKYTAADRCRYFDIARGSAVECAACLDLLVRKNIVSETEIEAAKELLLVVVSMLIGLIRSNSSERMREDPPSEIFDGD